MSYQQLCHIHWKVTSKSEVHTAQREAEHDVSSLDFVYPNTCAFTVIQKDSGPAEASFDRSGHTLAFHTVCV